MTALMVLTFASCFIGTSEITGRRYDEEGACWVPDSFVGENVYWWEYSTVGHACLDTGIHFLTVDDECWFLGGWCGDEFLNDPWVANGSVQSACPREWEEADFCE